MMLVAATLATVVMQSFGEPRAAETAEVEQTSQGDADSSELSIRRVEAITSSVDLNVDSQYFLIDIVPIPNREITYPYVGDAALDGCLRFSRILFRRIISPNAP